MADTSLSLFHPLIQRWFRENLGDPTDVQEQAWPVIAEGRHVLVTAPTGCGKTMTAFLWALQELITGAWPAGDIRVLYVSPLKALNNDIQRNLLRPLWELRSLFEQFGTRFPAINVLTRSGDTPGADRRRMAHHPPEILITTPESLNLILSSPVTRGILSGVRSVILDEIHAVAPTKRGTHLITAVERLTLLAGEFQRIALSATLKPLETLADFIGGYQMEGTPEDPHYRKRPVAIIQSRSSKQIDIRIRFPEDARETMEDGTWWPSLVRQIKEEIRRNRSTLVFTNSRRLTEKIARFINEEEPELIAYAHHGSLSREIRSVVEQRMKEGMLPAIVATSSLELGIDIGALDEVILIQTPFSVSSVLQRIGRAGHTVGEVSRAVIFPTHGMDFLSAAVMARAVLEGDIESTAPPMRPLDILAQVIVSMTGVEKWNLDDLFIFIRTMAPYRDLSRSSFDRVVDMLAGRYAESRLRELQPRVSVDRLNNTIAAREGALQLVYSSGGTIPDRGYYAMRMEGTGARIGELDEEFVWERSIGDTFTFGTQSWRIQQIDAHEVKVVPIEGRSSMPPFWKAEARDRDAHLAERIACFLEEWNDRLEEDAFVETLRRDYHMDEPAATELIELLKRQKSAIKTDLPHRHHLVIEEVPGLIQETDTRHVILHTLWGGCVNRPYALALAAAWEEVYHYPLELLQDDDCIVLMLPHDFDPSAIVSLVTPENLESCLRKRLERTGFFCARFRENAARALLLPRASFGRRMPLWLNRLRSKRLLGTLAEYDDFPILAETWRTCLQDEFDLETLRARLDEVRSGIIKTTHVTTLHPSPFTSNLVYAQTNLYMYMDDAPSASWQSNLREDVVRELVHDSELRPRIPKNVIEQFVEKAQRTAPGYAPGSATELLEWIKERILIPAPEWKLLLEAIQRDYSLDIPKTFQDIASHAVLLRLPDASYHSVIAIENLPRLCNGLQLSIVNIDLQPICEDVPLPAMAIDSMSGQIKSEDWIGDEANELYSVLLMEWLRYEGPISPDYISQVFGLSRDSLNDLLDDLCSNRSIVLDPITEGAIAPEVCDADNLEILLRLRRAKARPQFRALPVDSLPLFLAYRQGLTHPGTEPEALENILERLFGYPASAGSWEEDIFPARLCDYSVSWLDRIMKQHGLLWFGCGRERLTFCAPGDLELFRDPVEADAGHNETIPVSELFPDMRGRYDLMALMETTNRGSRELTHHLWNHAWQSRVSNDSFADVRKGIENGFKPEEWPRARQRMTTNFRRWKSTRPLAGNWFILRAPDPPQDALESEEIIKDRIRQLLRRYGVLFRELLDRELEPLRWPRIFRTLRLMELSGEVLAGRFFEGPAGIQFMTPADFQSLQQPFDEKVIYWMNATDPASLCGIKLDRLPELPRRVPTTHLVYHGRRLVLESRKSGRNITIHVPPEDHHLSDYLEFFRTLLNRQFNPLRNVQVEFINGTPALESPYCEYLVEYGFRRDYEKVILHQYD